MHQYASYVVRESSEGRSALKSPISQVMPIHSVKVFFSIKNVGVGGGGGEGGSAGYGPPLPSALPMVETVFNLTLERWAIFTMMPYL